MPDCDCLDYRVWGHICGRSGLPPGGWDNAWRVLPELRDPSPRPVPLPGDGFVRDRGRLRRLLNRDRP